MPCSRVGSADWCVLCTCSLLEENTGQGLLSGVGTALKDALSLGREVSSKDGLRLTLSGDGRLPDCVLHLEVRGPLITETQPDARKLTPSKMFQGALHEPI